MNITLDREEIQSLANLTFLRMLQIANELHDARSDKKIEELEGAYRYYQGILAKLEEQLENGAGA